MRRNKNTRRLELNQLERRDAPSVSASGANALVNTVTSGTQSAPAIAMDGDGDYVVAWQDSFHQGNGYGVFAQKYTAAGSAVGFELSVNTYLTGNQLAPAVAMNAEGDFVIVWESIGQDGSGSGIYGQMYDSAANKVGAEFRVNTYTTADQTLPAVAMDATGNFIVVWQSNGQDGSDLGVYCQRYDSMGVPLSDEFRVNTYTTNAQFEPKIAMDYLVDFVVAWTSDGQDGSAYGVYAQRFIASGAKVGSEFRVNTTTTSDQNSPSVAMNAAGDFMIAWQGFVSTNSNVYVQPYNAAGNKIGSELSLLNGKYGVPSLSRSANGELALVCLQGSAVLVNVLNPAGTSDASFFANTYSTGTRTSAVGAMDAKGDFSVAWAGEGSGDSSGVFMQRYVESTDGAPPLIAGIYTPGIAAPLLEGRRLTDSISSLSVSFSENMSVTGGTTGVNSVTNPANWGLTQDGVSIVNQITGITFSLNSTTDRYEANISFPSLGDRHNFVVTPGANLRDLAGNALDGDFNGSIGGAFSRRFQVAKPHAIGPEFKVNTTAGPTSEPSNSRLAVAADAQGNYIVCWSGSTTLFPPLFAQRYTAGGLPQGPEILVFSIVIDKPAIACDALGNFVVAFTVAGTDGNGSGIRAQRYFADGTVNGNSFVVNTNTTGNQRRPGVAMDAAGDTIFTWDGPDLVNSAISDIFARRFNSAGVALGNDFVVDSDNFYGAPNGPIIAGDEAGDSVIGWQVTGGSSNRADFSTVGRDGVVHGGIDIPGSQPAVAMDRAGDIVVAFATSSGTITVQRYSIGFVPQGGTSVSPSGQISCVGYPSLAMDRAGDIVIAWEGDGSQIDPVGIYARLLSGNPAMVSSGDLHVNTFTTGNQTFPAVAMSGAGDFVVAWDNLPDISAQRFAVTPPHVQSVQVNDGSAQRSRVSSLQVVFDDTVALPSKAASAFTLTRQSDSVAVTFSATAASGSGATTVTLNNFSGSATDSGSLADGRYTLRAVAPQIINFFGLGVAVDGNGDGISGDDYVLAGDPVLDPKNWTAD